mmetsp:Transcript_4599/g.13053  ORF Transcript_4599/g.13053 Transcript_4599/m.13053 type:complete len:365 (-) Transcript_4599:84-1178(-)
MGSSLWSMQSAPTTLEGGSWCRMLLVLLVIFRVKVDLNLGKFLHFVFNVPELTLPELGVLHEILVGLFDLLVHGGVRVEVVFLRQLLRQSAHRARRGGGRLADRILSLLTHRREDTGVHPVLASKHLPEPLPLLLATSLPDSHLLLLKHGSDPAILGHGHEPQDDEHGGHADGRGCTVSAVEGETPHRRRNGQRPARWQGDRYAREAVKPLPQLHLIRCQRPQSRLSRICKTRPPQSKPDGPWESCRVRFRRPRTDHARLQSILGFCPCSLVRPRLCDRHWPGPPARARPSGPNHPRCDVAPLRVARFSLYLLVLTKQRAIHRFGVEEVPQSAHALVRCCERCAVRSPGSMLLRGPCPRAGRET